MHQQAAPLKTAKRKRLKWRPWALFCVLATIVGAGVYLVQRGPDPIAITTERATIRDITRFVSGTGKIRPEVEVKISAEVAGEIVEMPVMVGQRVKKGDLLMRIKPDNYIARVKQAEASLSAAQADSLQRRVQTLNDQLDLRRAQDLFSKKLISETDYKAAETKTQVSQASYDSSLHQIDMAKSNLDQNRDLLSKCVIYSPMDGVISVLSSEIGERVVATGDFAGTEVMRVANFESMEARVDVNENDVVNVEVGDPVRIKVDAYPGKLLNGTVKQIASTATVKNEGTQQEVTNFEVRVQVVNPEVQLRPGMSASVEIETQTVHHVVAVPIQSVTVRSRKSGKTAEQLKQDREKQTGVNSSELERQARNELQRVVFLKERDKVNLVPVQTGIADNNFIEIRSGVKEGDEVVSGSYTAISKDLKEGSKVKIEQPKDAK
ncbi:MAG: efflux RND transporter periplasmic adaptor subunit [Verrucomicrobia bacterium]|jgi:HlyD family secretion protein|nr:efflux RND transporter periplasmic adaptor subunit [Verrucomicrobiota bacterium]